MRKLDKATEPWPEDHPIPVAGVILDSGTEILLVRPHHLDEFWLVSGYLEAWESGEDAAIRGQRLSGSVARVAMPLAGSWDYSLS